MRETFVVPNFSSLLESTETSEKIVIVSIIGKSSLSSHGLKVKSIGRMFSSNTNRNKQCTIEGYLDEETQVLYLHLYSLLDTEAFIKYYKELSNSTKISCIGGEEYSSDFLSVYNTVKGSFARAMQLLFYVSHVVLLSHPGSTFDINYIQIFKAVDTQRQKQSGVISDLLKNVGGLSSEWVNSGRPCTPRIVFYFERCPKQAQSNIKKLEHELEDRIYHILRKLRIVSSTNCSSLFAIPANQEYVFMEGSEGQGDRLGQAVMDLVLSCQAGGAVPVPEAPFCSHPSVGRSFHRFLQVHVQQARCKGFDDNIGTGRHAQQAPAHFELPTLEQWAHVTTVLYNFLVTDEPLPSLCTETRFSEQRCLKVLPLAMARYQEGLPSHYTRAEHDTRLQLAESVFNAQARGPLFTKYHLQLVEDCLQIWSGRRLCESPSLTGNPCTLPRHHKEPVEHCSAMRYVSSCDCGRSQAQRDDPYNPRQANSSFYELLAKECVCGTADRHRFPVFAPSGLEYRAAKLGVTPVKGVAVLGAGDCGPSETEDVFDARCSPPSAEDVEEMSGMGTGLGVNEEVCHQEVANASSGITSKSGVASSAALVRQASTTEYLPGMLTKASPPGLLPQFASWSLVCIGPSSLYSHNVGLLETHHPGFLSSTNYLLPWDVTVTACVGSRAWAPAPRGRRQATSFNVKVFIGTEYECPRGHRFMMSAPDRVLRATAGQVVKEQGMKVVRQDMPLYFPCPCRPSKPFIGQLMRLHMVTPKAPVQVMLDPQIQPATGAPVFIPCTDGPVALSQSSYWVLRLPYVYADENQTYLVASHSTDPQARLLARAWSVRSTS